MTTENLVKHVFLRTRDMSLNSDSNQVFLPRGGGETNFKNNLYISDWLLDQKCFLFTIYGYDGYLGHVSGLWLQ